MYSIQALWMKNVIQRENTTKGGKKFFDRN